MWLSNFNCNNKISLRTLLCKNEWSKFWERLFQKQKHRRWFLRSPSQPNRLRWAKPPSPWCICRQVRWQRPPPHHRQQGPLRIKTIRPWPQRPFDIAWVVISPCRISTYLILVGGLSSRRESDRTTSQQGSDRLSWLIAALHCCRIKRLVSKRNMKIIEKYTTVYTWLYWLTWLPARETSICVSNHTQTCLKETQITLIFLIMLFLRVLLLHSGSWLPWKPSSIFDLVPFGTTLTSLDRNTKKLVGLLGLVVQKVNGGFFEFRTNENFVLPQP